MDRMLRWTDRWNSVNERGGEAARTNTEDIQADAEDGHLFANAEAFLLAWFRERSL